MLQVKILHFQGLVSLPVSLFFNFVYHFKAPTPSPLPHFYLITLIPKPIDYKMNQKEFLQAIIHLESISLYFDIYPLSDQMVCALNSRFVLLATCTLKFIPSHVFWNITQSSPPKYCRASSFHQSGPLFSASAILFFIVLFQKLYTCCYLSSLLLVNSLHSTNIVQFLCYLFRKTLKKSSIHCL